MPGVFSKPSNKQANIDRFEEQQRQANIRAGTQRVDGIIDTIFDKPFYDRRRQAYVDYASPQIQDQYGDAQKELTFALDRSGNLNSSVRGQKFGELQKLYDTNKQGAADQALSYESEARNNVENARSGLIANLNATGDTEGAVNQALSRAQSLSAPQAFSPLSQIFASFTSGLGQQAAQERAEAASGGTYAAKYSTGLFAPRQKDVMKVSG